MHLTTAPTRKHLCGRETETKWVINFENTEEKQTFYIYGEPLGNGLGGPDHPTQVMNLKIKKMQGTDDDIEWGNKRIWKKTKEWKPVTNEMYDAM